MIHKKPVLLCIILILTCTFPGFTDGFRLVNEETISLTMNLRIAFLSEFTPPENKNEISLSDASLSLESKLYNTLSVKLSCDADIQEGLTDEYVLILKDIYARYLFHDFMSLSVGLFKVPFGEEIFFGSGERPYINKTETSDKIPPGRDLGVMISGKNIASLFGYNLGLFLGTEPDLPENAEKNYLAAGKVFIEYKKFSPLDILLGYNAYYHSFYLDVTTEQIAQGFFLKGNLKINKENTLTILAEYQERVLIRDVLNNCMDWRRGILGFTSYRYRGIEPYILLEMYDSSLLIRDDNDLFHLVTGFTAYFLPKDLLRIKFCYELEYPYYFDVLSHKISTLLQIEL
ncbi:MAG: hypothetical protein JXJ04_09145 [Spirochaetales bacterium]|nr:hypothetical protein [Spirochaetales bacterium]